MRRFEYTAVFDRLEQTLAGQLERVAGERAAAPGLLAELLTLPRGERYARALGDPRFHIYALVCHAIERAERDMEENPQRALDQARVARVICPRIDPRTCGGQAALADIEAFALAVEASALRALGEVALAEELFGCVRAILEQGGADLYLNARTDFLEALLRRDLGEAEEALHLTGRALRSLVSLGERDRARLLSDAGRAGVPLHGLTPPQGSPTAIH
jgi:hypothetical protein